MGRPCGVWHTTVSDSPSGYWPSWIWESGPVKADSVVEAEPPPNPSSVHATCAVNPLPSPLAEVDPAGPEPGDEEVPPPVAATIPQTAATIARIATTAKIGRASCRERV